MEVFKGGRDPTVRPDGGTELLRPGPEERAGAVVGTLQRTGNS